MFIFGSLQKSRKEMAEFFEEHNFVVTLSIDGTKNINDLAWVMANGESSYDAIFNNLDLWQGSSVGESARLIPARSRVRISPLLIKKGRISNLPFFIALGTTFPHFEKTVKK